MTGGGGRHVAVVADSWGTELVGGGPSYVGAVVRELVRRGRRVTVVAREADPRGAGEGRGEREAAPGAVFVPTGGRGAGEPDAGALAAALARCAPAVVHVNGLKAAAVAACRELRLPHLLTAHHVGLVCPAGALLRPGGAACPGPRTVRTCVRCANVWRRPRYGAGRAIGSLPGWIYRPLGRRLAARERIGPIGRGLVTPWLVERGMEGRRALLRDAQLVVAPSRFMWSLLARHGVPPARLRLVPHGVEAFAAAPVGAGAPVRFGYVGRVDPLKGLHLLTAAARAVGGRGGLEVHVFGAGRNARDEAYRVRAVAAAGPDVRVVEHGPVPRERMAEAYGAVDVVVVPSLVPEAFGLVVGEALAAGRPVIAFDAGALAELLPEGAGGVVVAEKSARALADAMRPFVEDPGLAARVAGGARRGGGVAEHVDRLEEIYAEAAG